MNRDYLSYSIDIVGNCNLRCPSCPVGNIDLKDTRPKGFILKELFYEIADKISREICMENGAHLNWKSDQKSIFNKNIAGNSIMSKILRFYVSNMNKNILGDYYKK